MEKEPKKTNNLWLILCCALTGTVVFYMTKLFEKEPEIIKTKQRIEVTKIKRDTIVKYEIPKAIEESKRVGDSLINNLITNPGGMSKEDMENPYVVEFLKTYIDSLN